MNAKELMKALKSMDLENQVAFLVKLGKFKLKLPKHFAETMSAPKGCALDKKLFASGIMAGTEPEVVTSLKRVTCPHCLNSKQYRKAVRAAEKAAAAKGGKKAVKKTAKKVSKRAKKAA